MDWFKHKIGSHDDPDISAARDKFGHAGYSIFFILLEVYGREFNRANGDGELTLSWRYFQQKTRTKRKQTEFVLTFYSECNRIVFNSFRESFTVKIPKFIELASNYTKYEKPKYLNKHLNTTDKNQNTEVEVDIEVDNNIKAESSALPSLEKPKTSLKKETTDPLIIELKTKAETLHQQKIFPEVYPFIQKAINEGKNIKAVLFTLGQCLHYKPKKPWGYCINILKIENGNYQEKDHQNKSKAINNIYNEILEKLK